MNPKYAIDCSAFSLQLNVDSYFRSYSFDGGHDVVPSKGSRSAESLIKEMMKYFKELLDYL